MLKAFLHKNFVKICQDKLPVTSAMNTPCSPDAACVSCDTGSRQRNRRQLPHKVAVPQKPAPQAAEDAAMLRITTGMGMKLKYCTPSYSEQKPV
jgi:hypothetical protein